MVHQSDLGPGYGTTISLGDKHLVDEPMSYGRLPSLDRLQKFVAPSLSQQSQQHSSYDFLKDKSQIYRAAQDLMHKDEMLKMKSQRDIEVFEETKLNKL